MSTPGVSTLATVTLVIVNTVNTEDPAPANIYFYQFVMFQSIIVCGYLIFSELWAFYSNLF